jgi:hypothetical protein
MAAAVQRIAIEAERHRFTFRHTRLTVLMTFSMMLVTGMRMAAPFVPAAIRLIAAYVRPSGTEAPGARRCGQADALHELRARVSSWPPLRLARLRCERGSVGVVSPAAPLMGNHRETRMRRVIGIDVHRTFGEVVIWEDGVLRHVGRVDMTRTALEGLGKKLRSTEGGAQAHSGAREELARLRACVS